MASSRLEESGQTERDRRVRTANIKAGRGSSTAEHRDRPAAREAPAREAPAREAPARTRPKAKAKAKTRKTSPFTLPAKAPKPTPRPTQFPPDLAVSPNPYQPGSPVDPRPSAASNAPPLAQAAGTPFPEAPSFVPPANANMSLASILQTPPPELQPPMPVPPQSMQQPPPLAQAAGTPFPPAGNNDPRSILAEQAGIGGMGLSQPTGNPLDMTGAATNRPRPPLNMFSPFRLR